MLEKFINVEKLDFLDRYFGILDAGYIEGVDGIKNTKFSYKGNGKTELFDDAGGYSVCINHRNLNEVALLYRICYYAENICKCDVGTNQIMYIYRRLVHNKEIMAKVNKYCNFD